MTRQAMNQEQMLEASQLIREYGLFPYAVEAQPGSGRYNINIDAPGGWYHLSTFKDVCRFVGKR